MNNTILKYTFLFRACIFLAISYSHTATAQTNLTFSFNDLLNWQPSAINQANVCTVPLSQRVMSTNYQLAGGLDTNTRILYSPDGMNNFGPYVDSAAQFNLFNFSHWQYIDILAWFGGSAGIPVIIPAKPWVDAAHKNGVKVIGTVFFAPIAFGGSQAAVQSFLQQDSAGNFLAAAQMIAMANYYNFDGWILNFETSVNSATGSLATSFVNQLDSAYDGEVIWYDAMLTNGSISYQNKLNANNAYFFQHSTGLFTNYNWSSANTVASSNTYATGIGGNPFNVYTGADMWPSRNAQPAFTDYTWLDKIITNNIAKTSVAMFATNFTFNYAPYSTFNNDPNAYPDFYTTERKIFSGLDGDPFTADNTWKGLAAYVPVRTVIISLPFQTDFNTGHGLNFYSTGNILSPGPWHNMSHQSVLPSWAFYANGVNIDYDFSDAYSGGSSIYIGSSAGGNYSIPLYSTNIVTSASSLKTELALKIQSGSAIDSLAFELVTASGGNVISVFHPSFNGSWEDLLNNNTAINNADTIIAVNLNIYGAGTFDLNLGKMGIDTGTPSSIAEDRNNGNSLNVYPNPSAGIINFIAGHNLNNADIKIYNVFGQLLVERKNINGNFYKLDLSKQLNGVYLVTVCSDNELYSCRIMLQH